MTIGKMDIYNTQYFYGTSLLVMPIVVSNRWYFHPKFFVKILWGLFSLAVLVIIGVFAPKVHDPFWTALVGSAPFGIMISILLFFLIAIAVTLVTYFVAAVAQYKKWLLFGAIGSAAIAIILMFVYLGSWGTIRKRSKYISSSSMYFYEKCKSTPPGAGCDWFIKNILKGDTDDFSDKIYDYVDQRTEDIGSSLLGCFLVWSLFFGIWLGLLFTDRDQPDCCSSERDGYVQQSE